MNFKGKVVLITGASSGIGAATAETFAKGGAHVVIVGRNVDNLKVTELKCKEVNEKINCLSIVADVTTEAKKIIDETINTFQRLDVLVNNAGILAIGNLLDIDIEQYDHVMNTNLRSVIILTQLAGPHLIKSEGSIINVSSIAGLRSVAGYISYGISKAAMDQFTKTVALELARHKVRVNSVNPGVIVTEIHKRSGMSDEAYAQYLERCKETYAMGRVGNVFEVAETILFLASSSASFITGVCLPIDGGKHLMSPH